VPLAILDPRLHFLRVNDAFAAADGISPDTHVGRSPVDVFQGAAAEPFVAGFHEVIATGRPVDLAIEGEVPATPGLRSTFAATLFPVRSRADVVAVGLVLRGRA
jgi:hypothetical protein